MTDRIKGFVVTLEKDMRDDDVEAIANAIRQLRGVAGVGGSVASTDDYMNRERIRVEFGEKLLRMVHPQRFHDDSTP